jgi:hypothetical protein
VDGSRSENEPCAICDAGVIGRFAVGFTDCPTISLGHHFHFVPRLSVSPRTGQSVGTGESSDFMNMTRVCSPKRYKFITAEVRAAWRPRRGLSHGPLLEKHCKTVKEVALPLEALADSPRRSYCPPKLVGALGFLSSTTHCRTIYTNNCPNSFDPKLLGPLLGKREMGGGTSPLLQKSSAFIDGYYVSTGYNSVLRPWFCYQQQRMKLDCRWAACLVSITLSTNITAQTMQPKPRDPFNGLNTGIMRTYNLQGAVLMLNVAVDPHASLDRQALVKLSNRQTSAAMWQTTHDKSRRSSTICPSASMTWRSVRSGTCHPTPKLKY